MYTISMLAKKANVGVETIRFYQRKGLLKQPTKPAQGYRQYSSDALSRVLFIKRAQSLGFTLSEIFSLLTLSANNCEDMQQLAEQKLEVIDEKINDLMNLKKSLVSVVKECRNNPAGEKCPVILSLRY